MEILRSERDRSMMLLENVVCADPPHKFISKKHGGDGLGFDGKPLEVE